MKVAIVGSRNIPPLTPEQLLPYIPLNCSQIISGGAEGIDYLAELAAQNLGIPLLTLRPQYSLYGKKAPLRRNRQIADRCDYLLAFWDGQSRGTSYTIHYCIQEHIPFRVVFLDSLFI